MHMQITIYYILAAFLTLISQINAPEERFNRIVKYLVLPSFFVYMFLLVYVTK